MDKRQQTCCFTGHRILPRGMEDELWTKTYAHLQPLLTQGVRYFGVGGALGFDTLIAERLLELRDIISPIKVILVLPFRSYQSRWTPEQQIRAAKIEARADKIVYCSDAPSRNAFLYRDRHLVNGSAYFIGYCTRTIGGSAYTLRYAREQGLTVWNIGEEQQDNLVEEARELFIGTIHSLRVEYPNVTVRLLDHAIWDYMAHRK